MGLGAVGVVEVDLEEEEEEEGGMEKGAEVEEGGVGG